MPTIWKVNQCLTLLSLYYPSDGNDRKHTWSRYLAWRYIDPSLSSIIHEYSAYCNQEKTFTYICAQCIKPFSGSLFLPHENFEIERSPNERDCEMFCSCKCGKPWKLTSICGMFFCAATNKLQEKTAMAKWWFCPSNLLTFKHSCP